MFRNIKVLERTIIFIKIECSREPFESNFRILEACGKQASFLTLLFNRRRNLTSRISALSMFIVTNWNDTLTNAYVSAY